MIRIRMYNVGFGDCILVTVDQPDAPWRMLVDCGVHASGVSAHSIASVVEAIITEVTTDGAPHLDLIVATHRHRDHVSGFADPRWAAVTVGEVWLPWTEDPADEHATALRLTQQTAARGITSALATTSLPSGIMEAAMNSLTNEAAMVTLQSGFAGAPPRRYLPINGAALPAPARPPGLTAGLIHILGPSHDPAVLRHMEPPASETYRSIVPTAIDSDSIPVVARPTPFPAALTLTQAEYESQYSILAKALPKATRGRIINIGATGERDLLATIAGLDNAINNTSLIITLEVGDDVLLLPGDAQWGPWQATLGNADTLALINRTTFYKVSHHGSYNGTPKSLVTKLDRKIAAGISVNRVTQWPKIPERALVDQLNRQMTIFQTNKPPPPNTNISQASDGSWIELALD
jgi:beta-lactamase superfamily II metal-dependent hydrolase